MDYFESKQNRPDMIWNVLSILVVMAIIGLVVFFGSIFFNPYSALNPFPPDPLPTMLAFPTATNTPLPYPPTFTATITIQPSATETQLPTWTPIPTLTLFFIGSATTPAPTLGSGSGMPFEATFTNVASEYYHPEAGCNWMGVAGQAVDMNNSPFLYAKIHLSGVIGGKFIDYTGLSGTFREYGLAGFEFVLGEKPIGSSDTLWIQLLDQQDLPLSDQIKLTTYADCSKNLVMVRFKKVR